MPDQPIGNETSAAALAPHQAAADPAGSQSIGDPSATTAENRPFSLATAQLAVTTRYELGDEIARGGMGLIYRATDTTFGREVAVKILQADVGIASVSERRFADEALITGQLQHPAIPPVHDLGILPDGRTFLAMKLIKGRTMDELLAERPNPAHDRGHFVAVFEQVCQAVAYAHRHDVIHRDLKPANVMVGSFGEVQVMDWGLAKVLGFRQPSTDERERTSSRTAIYSLRNSDDPCTEDGSVLGTPAFMPPEQAVGAVNNIDARSDVFGLGAILAVILTGKPPYSDSSFETTRIKAAQGKVGECFARLDACGADPELLALAKRCLNPEPANRPTDASEVAREVAELRVSAEERAQRAELERVKAEGDKAAAELKHLEQRKRRSVQFALAVAVGLLVFGGGVFAWWIDRQATEHKIEQERMKTQRAQELAAVESHQAASRLRVSATVTSALQEARSRAEEAWAHADDPERMNAAVDLTLGALHRAEGFADAGEITEDVRSALAEAQRTVAILNRHARLFLTAERILQDHAQGSFGAIASMRTARRLADAFQKFGWTAGQLSPQSVADTIVASRVRNQILGHLGEWSWHDPREQWVKAVLQISRHRAGGNLDTWQSIRDLKDKKKLVAFAASPGALELGPEQICQLGHDLASAQEREARLALLRRSVERFPKHVWLRFDLMETCNAHSPPLYTEALQHAAAAAALRPYSPIFQVSLGNSLRAVKALDAAEAAYRRSIKLDPKYAISHGNLGGLLIVKGDPAGAEAEYREAIRLAPLDPRIAPAHYNLGNLLKTKGDHAGAEAEFRKAIRLAPAAPKSSKFYVSLAGELYTKHDMAGAEARIRQAIQLEPNNARAQLVLGLIQDSKGNRAEGEAAIRKAIQLDPNDAQAHDFLGSVLEKKGALDEAIACYREALRIDPKHTRAARSLSQAERMRELLRRLPDVLGGKAAPTTPAERCEFAHLCGRPFVGRYTAAVRLFEEAFAADPKLADNQAVGRRYDPACYAARAARGDGIDAPTDPTTRAALRAKALNWLRTDLIFYKHQVASSIAPARNSAIILLRQMLIDADLSALRPGPARMGMPTQEQEEWDTLWADIKTTLAGTRQLPPPPQQAQPTRGVK